MQLRECVGPGATQLYVPTDAPPPYSLSRLLPELDGALDAGSGHSPGTSRRRGCRARVASALSPWTPCPLTRLCVGPAPIQAGCHCLDHNQACRAPQDYACPNPDPALGPERIL